MNSSPTSMTKAGMRSKIESRASLSSSSHRAASLFAPTVLEVPFKLCVANLNAGASRRATASVSSATRRYFVSCTDQREFLLRQFHVVLHHALY